MPPHTQSNSKPTDYSTPGKKIPTSFKSNKVTRKREERAETAALHNGIPKSAGSLKKNT
jgi:hypothetical protein